MRFVRSSMSVQDMQEQAEEAFQLIEEKYVKLFGTQPLEDSIAWVCRKCGWWDDTTDSLVVFEKLVAKKSEGGIVLPHEQPEERIRVGCPKCSTTIKAVKKEVYLNNARKKGTSLQVEANKNKTYVM